MDQRRRENALNPPRRHIAPSELGTEGLEPGTVVRLDSGGPKMTVEKLFKIDGEPAAFCSWFEGEKKKDGSFCVAALVVAEK
jgi:uncharacterized protein YodC (DUF2158 family)